MPVDVGGYRVREMDKLPYDLVTRRLKLPVSCYDFDCAATCDGSDTTCYNVNGAYGHSSYTIPATKVYAVYDNAWWYSVLGKMQGSFGNRTEELPLAGRYHDGPVRCVVGEGRDGGAVYSETPVAFGNCTGALLVHYTLFFDNAWEGLQVRPEASALSIFTPNNNASLLEQTHRVLMDYHADELR
eukprot:Sspe_Gene.1795::Locus_596_Transcript_5_9_Confidence_0.560_Length_949::g.1795::m.1795